jgi:undecaprenyl-diphosphatase
MALALAALVAHTSTPDPVDRAVDTWLAGHLGLHVRALTWLMDLGEPIQVTIATIVLVAVFLALRRIGLAVVTAVSVPAAALVTEAVLKPAVGRTLGSFAVYPSGHTCMAATLATVIIIAVHGAPGRAGAPAGRLRRVLRLAVTAACVVLPAAVAVAMISLRFHYFTDTVGGAAVGIAVVLTTALLLDSPATRTRMFLAAARFGRRLPRGG